MTKIYIDANFAPQLAHGLNTFQQHLNLKEQWKFEVLSITDVFGPKVADEEWIPKLGKEKAVVITQDIHIQSTRHQRDLYHQHGLLVFFVKPPSNRGFSFWEMLQLLVEHWEDIKKKSAKTKRPYAFRCSSRKPFEPLE
jgi:hypothetical protein